MPTADWGARGRLAPEALPSATRALIAGLTEVGYVGLDRSLIGKRMRIQLGSHEPHPCLQLTVAAAPLIDDPRPARHVKATHYRDHDHVVWLTVFTQDDALRIAVAAAPYFGTSDRVERLTTIRDCLEYKRDARRAQEIERLRAEAEADTSVWPLGEKHTTPPTPLLVRDATGWIRGADDAARDAYLAGVFTGASFHIAKHQPEDGPNPHVYVRTHIRSKDSPWRALVNRLVGAGGVAAIRGERGAAAPQASRWANNSFTLASEATVAVAQSIGHLMPTRAREMEVILLYGDTIGTAAGSQRLDATLVQDRLDLHGEMAAINAYPVTADEMLLLLPQGCGYYAEAARDLGVHVTNHQVAGSHKPAEQATPHSL